MSHTIGTSQNFSAEVLNHSGKVLVDFWATWCGPCQMLKPIIDELGTDLKDTIKIVEIDVDAEPTLSSEYNVASIPTVIIFDNGQIKEVITGFHQKQDYLKALNK